MAQRGFWRRVKDVWKPLDQGGPTQRQRGKDKTKNVNKVPNSVIWSLVFFLGFGATFVIFHSKGAYWAVSLMWSGACLVAGALFGFLFGIPKTLQGKSSPMITRSAQAADSSKKDDGAKRDEENGRPGQLVNTNLEEISDWLTKILVGLGLTEVRRVPDALSSAGGRVAMGLGGVQESAFAQALIIYFSVIGFFGGYLLTRLFLQRAFFEADFWLFLKRAAGQAGEVVSEATSAIAGALRDIEKRESVAVLEADVQKLEEWLDALPRHRELHIVLGRLYRWLGRLDSAIQVLTDFIQNKEAENELDSDVGAALFNRACYKALKAANVPEEQGQTLRKDAVQDLNKGLQWAPELKEAASKDEDLHSLRNEPEFPRAA